MPDVYATITDADEAVLRALADTLEVRAADPGQAAIREDFLADVPFPDGARVRRGRLRHGPGGARAGGAGRRWRPSSASTRRRSSCSGRASWPGT